MKILKRIKDRYGAFIESASQAHNVPIEIIAAVIRQESAGDFKAVSRCGAIGLMQLMPATAKRFGVKSPYNVMQNIEGGTKYLAWLLNHFQGRIELVLAAYNAGEGAVKKHGNQIPPYKETRAYVPRVMCFAKLYRDLIENPNGTEVMTNEKEGEEWEKG